MLATIVILVVTVAAVQLIGDGLVRLTTPHSRLRSGAVRPLRRRAPAV
jgi:ABC-type dipeptide/oligopeptide/nickel transport system permease subunit